MTGLGGPLRKTGKVLFGLDKGKKQILRLDTSVVCVMCGIQNL